MRTPDEVAAMLRLHGLGWGTRRIAAELGCDRETVQRYVAAGGWAPYRRRPGRPRKLEGHGAWLAERLRRHRGNADVVRQELEAELGVRAALRTVEREVAPLRREMEAEARATVRFETPPGRQMQVDFGQCRVAVEDEPGGEARARLFVATLGHSRRVFVRAFRHERQSAWLDGVEGASSTSAACPPNCWWTTRGRWWTGTTRRRARCCSTPASTPSPGTGACGRWPARPTAPARKARTGGASPTPSATRAKRNAVAGRRFPTWSAFEAHLARWTREVADLRVHGTTGEAPMARFLREEAVALRPLGGRPPFRLVRELARRVQSDACVEVDTNHYSVPWRLIGAHVSVEVGGGEVRVSHAGAVVARHAERLGRRERAVLPAHLQGVLAVAACGAAPPAAARTPVPAPELLRPLAEYEAAAGGAW